MKGLTYKLPCSRNLWQFTNYNTFLRERDTDTLYYIRTKMRFLLFAVREFAIFSFYTMCKFPVDFLPCLGQLQAPVVE